MSLRQLSRRCRTWRRGRARSKFWVVLALDPASEQELVDIGDDALRDAVERVCADPSGQREPRHKDANKFRNASRYVNVGDRDIWELRTSKYRGLFVIAKGSKKDGIFFIPIKGTRFMTLGACPWHKGK
jgi:hypothetical protein